MAQETDELEFEAGAKAIIRHSGRIKTSLYLIRCGEYTKIGISDSPERRIEEIQVSSPYRCELLLSVVLADAYLRERHWHQYFARKRINNEWFQLSESDVLQIISEESSKIKSVERKNYMEAVAARVPVLSESAKLLYTVKESATILSMSVISVRRLIERGLLHPNRSIRHIRIPRQELERFCNAT